jgi:hypothetical protein
MGSAAMNHSGDFAIGYSASSHRGLPPLGEVIDWRTRFAFYWSVLK